MQTPACYNNGLQKIVVPTIQMFVAKVYAIPKTTCSYQPELTFCFICEECITISRTKLLLSSST